MNTSSARRKSRRTFVICARLLSAALACLLFTAEARAFTLQVVDQNGAPITGGYRWLLEEDNAALVVPLVHDPGSAPGVGIHKSHAPVVAAGASDDLTPLGAVDPSKRYIVSVLPDEGYTLGAAHVPLGLGAADVVTVRVAASPLVTAQISILVFHDNQSINGAPDLPAEPGLSGVRILLFDQLGQVSVDVFGNPLGTTYNPDGSVQMIGNGIYTEDWSPTNPFGRAPDTTKHGRVVIKNIAPGKYGVRAVPEGDVKGFAGQVFSVPATDWIQTSTIEGTPGIDAWVKSGEPPYFAEAGFFDVHAFIGFVLPQQMTKPSPTGVLGAIAGQAVSVHQARPPLSPSLSPGRPVPNAWVGLNDLGAADEQVYAQPAAPDGTFTIQNVPPGTYLLTLWDRPLDMIMDFRTVVVPPEGGMVDLGQVAYYRWFGRLEGTVFHDADENAFRNPGEAGIPQQAMNLRFRDGSIYQRTFTDHTGFYHFEEVFPFFKWLVMEVDATRLKPTGLTTIVDNGGALLPGTKLNPQPQLDQNGPIINPNTGDNLSRTTADGALTQGVIVYADQTNVVDWGKASYGPGENGGIAGIVFYQTTRAEDDPRYVAGDDWEPGVPGVRVNLHQVVGGLDADGRPVDTFLVNTALTDSWDASLPTGCKWLGMDLTLGDNASYVDCAEILSNWNQVRPAVYDGAYAFFSHYPSGIEVSFDDLTGKVSPVLDAEGQPVPNDPDEGLVQGIPPGQYVIEIVPPAGYEVVKEEDKNVDFGDAYEPRTELPPPPCVGDIRTVPQELDLFPGVPGAFAGQDRPLCDRRLVDVVDGQNGAADFGIFTRVPKAGRIVGIITNDVALEFSPTSPRKGDNLAPSWMPVSLKDHLGREITRVYADEWGVFDVLLPSTYTVNIPTPTGVSPGIVQVCLNDMGDPLSPDPRYNPAYARPCFNFDVWPGKTIYADVPILPIGAMTASHTALDCAIPAEVPEIYRADGPGMQGPYVDPTGGAVEITIQGSGFGDVQGSGSVTLTPPIGPTLSLFVVAWSNQSITATVPEGAPTGQLAVVNAQGARSILGVTLHVRSSSYNPPVVHVPLGGSIQAAIDAAAPGTLILVEPGIHPGNLIVYKPLELQGYGARSTVLESGLFWTQEVRDAWNAKLADIIANGLVSLIPGERADFYLEQGAGVMVLGSTSPALAFNRAPRKPRVDGFTIRGAVQGGGVFVNAHATHFEIGNNRMESNQGSFGGGVRVGTPSIVNTTNDGYNGSSNVGLVIHHNHIAQNGAIDGGGGVALFNGSDFYVVRDNYICGNFSLAYGGGIAHFGLMNNGRIEANTILFNEAFDEGGGVVLAGELPLQGGSVLSPGSGSVIVTRNLIQGNLAGDDGGGIRTLMTNGQDVVASPSNPSAWHRVVIENNMVVNNVSADSGGGISLDDSAHVFVIHNTIANNDSTATGTDAFGGPCPASVPEDLCQGGVTPAGGLVSSVPQPAGVVANVHSVGLQAAFGAGFEQAFSNPVLWNNIIRHNRGFHWDATLNGGLGGLSPDPSTPFYWDIEVMGVPGAHLDPQFCALTAPTGIDGFAYASNNVVDPPPFVSEYANVFAATSGGSALGNFVTVAFQPLTPTGDYHLSAHFSGASESYPASVVGPPLEQTKRDFDRDVRPLLDADIGADQRVP